jgi:hypothetical protein
VFLSVLGGSRKGKKTWKITQEVDSQKTHKTDANVDRVQTLVCSDRRLGLRLVAEELIWIRKQCNRLLYRIWEWENVRKDGASNLVRNSVRFLAKKTITEMDHSPYSPDLPSCDFWLFPKLKMSCRDKRFADIPDIQCNMTLLRGIPEKIFQDCFQPFPHEMHNFIGRVFWRRQQPLVHR